MEYDDSFLYAEGKAVGAALIPVLMEEGHDRHGVEQLSAHGPAGFVDAVVGYLDGREALAGQCLQRSKHRTAHKSLAQLRLVHEGIVLKRWEKEGKTEVQTNGAISGI